MGSTPTLAEIRGYVGPVEYNSWVAAAKEAYGRKMFKLRQQNGGNAPHIEGEEHFVRAHIIDGYFRLRQRQDEESSRVEEGQLAAALA